MAKAWMIVVGIILIVIFIVPLFLVTNLVLQLETLSTGARYIFLGLWIFFIMMVISGILLLVFGIKRD